MENSFTIQQELSEITSTLAESLPVNVFAVPENYWERVTFDILNKIKGGEEAKYYFTKELPYAVPVDYFSNLSGHILQKIKKAEQTLELSVSEEMETISPLINSIGKTGVYTVPEGYFETVKIPAAKPGQAKVISMNKASRFIRYAVAAIICGVLAIGGYLLTLKPTGNLQASREKTNTEIKKLSEAEIIDLLSGTSTAAEFSKKSEGNKSEIEHSVKQISDEGIKQFLKETGDQEGI